MQCERCGGPIGNRITRINGVTICARCAQNMGIDTAFKNSFGSAFPVLNELTNAIMASGNDLEFTANKVACPRCGTKLKEFEANRQVGCIECYNFFNNPINRIALRLHGSTEYMGRKPGEKSDIMPDIEISDVDSTNEDVKDENEKKSDSSKKATGGKSLYDKFKNADLGMIDDNSLEEAMKQAAASEDYAFAARLRDELKSRKGGDNNGN